MLNSYSLEHSQTNLFALVSVHRTNSLFRSFELQLSLDDIKWQCYRRRAQGHSDHLAASSRADHYKDPILLAFWRASQDDRLCAWRRVTIDDEQRIERELWLFSTNDDFPSDFEHLQRLFRSLTIMAIRLVSFL
jgi:hypothetical protein